MIRTSTLDCGVRVVTEHMADALSVTSGFWVGTGSRDETGADAGCSHFLEHLLFKGTATRSARDVAEVVESVGGEINAFTTKEYTAFYVRTLAEDAELGIDVLSDIFWSPAFRADEVEAERQVILEEILMHGDEPADLVHEVCTGALYPEHPLGREVLGEEATVEAMTTDRIREFFAQHYRPANVVAAAAGAVDHEVFCADVERRFAGPDGGARPVREAPSEAPQPLAVVKRKTEQAHLVVAVPGPDRHSPDRYALSVLNHALGGGTSSRLFQEIREERGLAYSVSSYRSAFHDTGLLAVYAGTAPSRAREVLDLVLAEMDHMAGAGVTERELEVAKGHLVGEMLLSLEDSASRMSRIARSVLLHGEVLSIDEVAARVRAVTLDDVADVAGRVLGAPRTLSVVGPFDRKAFAGVAA